MLHEARRGQVDQQLAHEIVNGAAFPPATRPAGAAESDERCNVPTYRKGRELALEEANGATFPPMAGPGARALGGQQCNVSTYGRAGSPCLGKPTVQYSHLRRGQQALLRATNGAAFPPTVGPGAGALGGQRCRVLADRMRAAVVTKPTNSAEFPPILKRTAVAGIIKASGNKKAAVNIPRLA